MIHDTNTPYYKYSPDTFSKTKSIYKLYYDRALLKNKTIHYNEKTKHKQ